jgi:hypothetical protein
LITRHSSTAGRSFSESTLEGKLSARESSECKTKMDPSWLAAHLLTKCSSDGANRASSMSYLSASKGTVSLFLKQYDTHDSQRAMSWLLFCAICTLASRTKRFLNSRSPAGPNNLSWIDGRQPQDQSVRGDIVCHEAVRLLTSAQVQKVSKLSESARLIAVGPVDGLLSG